MKTFCQELCATFPPERAVLDAPMARHTTFRIGGPADLLIDAATPQEARRVLCACHEAGCPVLVIGNGSNLLVSDRGIRGVVLRLGDTMAQVAVRGTLLTAGAGTRLGRAARIAAGAGLSGLAFAEGIPGTLGGGLAMNAGAYGGELSQVVGRVLAMDENGETRWYSNQELRFAYRDSLLQQCALYALEAELRLVPGDAQAIQADMEQLSKKRQEKQPLAYPSAGSTFKRPAQGFASALIDAAGLKGERVGGAVVSEKHAGFVINNEGASSADVLALMRQVRRKVYVHSGILLMPEVRCVGEFWPGELPEWEDAP